LEILEAALDLLGTGKEDQDVTVVVVPQRVLDAQRDPSFQGRIG
jgi:hypothetical protein